MGALLRGLRLCLFRPVPRFAADPTRGVALATVLLALLMGIALEVTYAGADLTFHWKGLAAAFAGWAVFSVLIWLFRPARARFGLTRVIADCAAIGCWFTLPLMTLPAAYAAIQSHSAAVGSAWIPYGLWAAVLVWWAAANWRAGYLAWTGSDWRFGIKAPAFLLVATLLMPSWNIVSGRDTQPPAFDVWQIAQGYWWYYTNASNETGDEPEYDRVDVEAAYYRQPQLVSESLKNIAPSDPARADIYFVAAAGFAEQGVFKKEAKKARKLFDSRFGTKGRSLVMLNHRHTVDYVPLANASNLDAVLSGLAGKMDIENDFLVLFLTSHGSKRRFSVSFDGFSLNDLTPPRLLDILHRSGIKNRVLIISACFSGSFIPELANENTLIMTAAASDRTSFGCSNEREWTYFGDALFNRAFTTTYAFENAFDMAKGTVGRWEKRDGLTPSEPQMSVGSAIKPRLEALAKEFERAAGSSTVEMQTPSTTAIGERADALGSP